MMPTLLLALLALTHPRPEQIRNIEQVRICGEGAGDNRPGTLISGCQIQDGRNVCVWTMTYGPPADPLPSVCIVNYIRVMVPTRPGYNIQQNVRYTQYGLQQLLTDPAWMAWWNAQDKTMPAEFDSTGTARRMIMRLLTTPRQ